MFSKILSRLTYANIMATLAFFVALSGASYAAIKLPDHSVGTKQLKKASVGTKQLKKAAVGTKQLKRAAVGTKQLKRQSVGNPQLQTNSVGATQLLPRSVGTAKLQRNSVGTEQLQPEGVTADDLAPNSVGPNSLQGNAVGSDQLAPASVGEREVKPFSLTYGAFAPDQVSPRLFAHGSSSGVLGVSAGVTSLTRASKGIYEVQFNRDLHGCVPVSNVGFGHGPGVIGAGGTAQASLFGNSGVRVTVYRKGFTFNDVEDSDFNLIVVC